MKNNTAQPRTLRNVLVTVTMDSEAAAEKLNSLRSGNDLHTLRFFSATNRPAEFAVFCEVTIPDWTEQSPEEFAQDNVTTFLAENLLGL